MPRKEPQRMCVSCREMQDKKGLLRIVRTPEGLLNIDLSGKQAGRGAYICAATACFNKAQKSRAFERTLNCKPPDDFWLEVEKHLQTMADI